MMAEPAPSMPLLDQLLQAIDAREPVALVTVIDASGCWSASIGQRGLVWLDESRGWVGDLALPHQFPQILQDSRQALHQRNHRTYLYERQGDFIKLFVEVQVQPPHLIIVGAGHIAVPLASIAKINDFQVTVLDDRPQYAHPTRFPTADRVIAGPFRQEIDNLRPRGSDGGKLPFDNHTYMVLVTRGHQYDIDSLLEVLGDPMAYIGMIGSQRRIRAVFELLEKEQGIPGEKFDRVYAPIGIDIGARTPAEIAVCIMAEIINVLRDGPALPMREQIQQERQRRRERAK
ncbi:MAG: XdhC/CoxI family protein [Chloroflexota bacterium]